MTLLTWLSSTLNTKKGKVISHFRILTKLGAKTKPSFRCPGTPNVSNYILFRYLGPNTGNMHIVADLYAEVIGVLAQAK